MNYSSDSKDLSLIQKFKIFDNEDSIIQFIPEIPETKKPVSFQLFDIEDNQTKSKELSQNPMKLKIEQIENMPFDSPKNETNGKNETIEENLLKQEKAEFSQQNLNSFHNLESSKKNTIDSLSEEENTNQQSKSKLTILDQGFKNKSVLFRDLEDQNKFIEEINNANTGDFYKFKKLKKKKNIFGLIDYSLKNQEVIPMLQNIPKKEVIANEFNQANYMFFNNENKEAKINTRNERKLRLIKMGILEDVQKKIEGPKKKVNKTGMFHLFTFLFIRNFYLNLIFFFFFFFY